MLTGLLQECRSHSVQSGAGVLLDFVQAHVIIHQHWFLIELEEKRVKDWNSSADRQQIWDTDVAAAPACWGSRPSCWKWCAAGSCRTSLAAPWGPTPADYIPGAPATFCSWVPGEAWGSLNLQEGTAERDTRSTCGGLQSHEWTNKHLNLRPPGEQWDRQEQSRGWSLESAIKMCRPVRKQVDGKHELWLWNTPHRERSAAGNLWSHTEQEAQNRRPERCKLR